MKPVELFIQAQQKRLNDYVNRTKQELKEACRIYRETSNLNDTNRAFHKPLIKTDELYDNVVKTTNNYVIALHKEKSCL